MLASHQYKKKICLQTGVKTAKGPEEELPGMRVKWNFMEKGEAAVLPRTKADLKSILACQDSMDKWYARLASALRVSSCLRVLRIRIHQDLKLLVRSGSWSKVLVSKIGVTRTFQLFTTISWKLSQEILFVYMYIYLFSISQMFYSS
jgi:hypothetical protein